MLRKLTLSLLALAISSHSFALEIYKGTILNHKESTTGGITVTFKNGAKQKSLRALSADDSFEPIYIYTNAEQQSAKLGELANIQGEHDVSIQNPTEITQQYGISISTCVGNDIEHTSLSRCAHSYYDISLEPQGYFDESRIPDLLVTFNDTTPRALYTHVEVSKQLPSGEIEYIGSASANAVITVSAN
jgi:hypothetical protein